MKRGHRVIYRSARGTRAPGTVLAAPTNTPSGQWVAVKLDDGRKVTVRPGSLTGA